MGLLHDHCHLAGALGDDDAVVIKSRPDRFGLDLAADERVGDGTEVHKNFMTWFPDPT